MQRRVLNPHDIALPPGYKIEVFARDLTAPINLVFHHKEMYLADAGITSGSGKVLKLTPEGFKVIAEGFNPPLTGITFYQESIYVAHRGFVTAVRPDGEKVDILAGLPSLGDHHNNRVVFGPDGKMYFGQGTATNTGVVGEDNADWVKKYPFFHDYPGQTLEVRGVNYITKNFLTSDALDSILTGAYSPFGVPTMPTEVVKGVTRASGSILRANPDGTALELVASGLRNPFRLAFDQQHRLFSTNHGMDVRGSRPVANSPDEFQFIRPGVWYGWPDYTGGLPVTLPEFKPEGMPQPELLMAFHPMRPPQPHALFTPHAAIMGFDFNYSRAFGPIGDVYIAEFGPGDPRTTGGQLLPGVGHKVSHIDMRTGQVTPFALNKTGLAASATGSGGFERPIDTIFGPDGAMYIADFGLDDKMGQGYLPMTGVIWRVTAV